MIIAIKPIAPFRALAYFLTFGVAFWVGSGAAFGPIDDHRFVTTLLQGKPFGFYISQDIGRFVPLTAQDYVLLSRLFFPSPALFYGWNALKVVVVGILLLHILDRVGAEPFESTLMLSLLLLSPAFANSVTRLHAGEFNLMILLLGFVLCCQKMEQRQERQQGQEKRQTIALSCVALTLMLTSFFYKEPACLFALAFGAFELRRLGFARSERRWFLVALILISIVYVAGYYRFFVNRTVSYATSHAQEFSDVAFSFVLNDPFVWLILNPVGLIRLLFVATGRSSQTMYDSLLVASLTYSCVFLLLQIYAPYYMLPVYAFGLPAIAGLVARNVDKKQLHVVFMAGLCGLVLNQAPVALSDYSFNKAVPINYATFIAFLGGELERKTTTHVNKRKDVVVSGVSAGWGIEIFVSLIRFLEFQGIGPAVYDLHASIPPDNNAIFKYHANRKLSFSAFMEEQPYAPKVGDWIVTTPFGKSDSALEASLGYHKLFDAPQKTSLPRMSLAEIISTAFINGCHSGADTLTSRRRPVGFAVSEMKRGPEQLILEPLGDFRYEAEPLDRPPHWKAEECVTLRVRLKNSGTQPWPANGRHEEGPFVHMAYLWLDAYGERMVLEGGRTVLPQTVLPGEQLFLMMYIQTPPHRGKYQFVLSPVQEDVAWFYSNHQGVPPQTIELE